MSICLIRYRFEDRGDVGPDHLPVPRTYEAAKAQHDKTEKRRVELIKINTPLVAQFQKDEEARQSEKQTKEGMELDDKERSEVDKKEVKTVCTDCLELVFEMFRFAFPDL